MGVELITQCNVMQFHSTPQMREAFIERYESDKQYLNIADDERLQPYFNFNYGVGEIDPCMLINLNLMLDRWKSQLENRNQFFEEHFDHSELSCSNEVVKYRNITAKKIIFCNGTDAFDLPYFALLPYAKNKGEALLAKIPGLPAANIFKQALSIVPWKDDIFWIGSTYQWKYNDLQPTESFRKKAEEVLKFWLKIPFTIIDHIASERPATVERRPFVGLHPVHSSIGIFNGMGTKGCSLAPYFAHQLAQHLVFDTPIHPEADVQRFKRILSSSKA
jgi:glycine/D-amino acid oxidase-like deaminating enzyme